MNEGTHIWGLKLKNFFSGVYNRLLLDVSACPCVANELKKRNKETKKQNKDVTILYFPMYKIKCSSQPVTPRLQLLKGFQRKYIFSFQVWEPWLLEPPPEKHYAGLVSYKIKPKEAQLSQNIMHKLNNMHKVFNNELTRRYVSELSSS